jgi:hypothetical protein
MFQNLADTARARLPEMPRLSDDDLDTALRGPSLRALEAAARDAERECYCGKRRGWFGPQRGNRGACCYAVHSGLCRSLRSTSSSGTTMAEAETVEVLGARALQAEQDRETALAGLADRVMEARAGRASALQVCRVTPRD